MKSRTYKEKFLRQMKKTTTDVKSVFRFSVCNPIKSNNTEYKLIKL